MSRYVSRKFPPPVDPAAVAADWARRGYTCDRYADPPGRAWNDFVHDCDELVTVLEGRLLLSIDGAEQVLEPGDEALIPRGSRHSVRNIHAGSTRWLYGYARRESV